MAVATVDEFVSLVKRSGLIAEGQLDAFLADSVLRPDDASAIADALHAGGLITEWQRDKLLDGRYKGFFLGKYKILAQLGAGAMGTVFLAEHLVMRHRVAIKTLAKRLLGKDAYIRRFEQEARAAAAVNHPRVVRAFDFDSSGDLYYLVMEYVEGEDLQKIVLRDGVLPVPVAAECIRQTAEGLAAAHEAGLVHRDIKPSNLLVDPLGNVRILDLGLARLIDEDEPSLTLVHESKMIGTVDYLSPEQARNSHHIDSRADLYSLGCTLYFLLSGQPPFGDGTLTQRVIEHQTKLPVDIRQRRRDCPAELAFICHKLLAKSPDDRFQTAEEVAAALAEWTARYEGRVSGESDAMVAPARPSVLEHEASRSRGGSSVIGDDSELAANHDTIDSARAGSSTASSRSGASGRSSGGSGDELAFLEDDDALDGSPTPAAPTSGSRGGSHGGGTGGSKSGGSKGGSGSKTSGSEVKRSGKSASGSKPSGSSVVRRSSPAADAVDALQNASLPPLPTPQDSLVDLLQQELPDSLVSTAPAGSFSPLGVSAEALAAAKAAPLDSLTSNSTTANAYLKAAAAEAAARSKRSWGERLQALVSEEGPGGIAYSIWFLVGAGMTLGLIVCLIGLSYYSSTQAPKVNKDRQTEGREQE